MGVIKSQNAPASLAVFSMADIEAAAKRILLRAQQQAEQLLTEAQAGARELREKAFADGFTEGRQSGLAKGHEEGAKAGHAAAVAAQKEKMNELIATLTAAAHSLDTSRLKLESDGLAEVVKLAAGIARRVTKRQGELDPAVLEANLSEAMKLVVHAADVRVAVHPTQKATLDDVLPRLQLSWPNLEHVELIEDPAIAPGGCRVFTAQGHIDADLDTQLDRIVAELLPGTSGAA
jgi:flagellar assembly protein FliH